MVVVCDRRGERRRGGSFLPADVLFGSHRSATSREGWGLLSVWLGYDQLAGGSALVKTLAEHATQSCQIILDIS